MIVDLDKFIAAERPCWMELESMLKMMEDEPGWRLKLDQVQRFQYLYDRTAAGLGKIVTFASEPETRHYLEALVARAYGEIHETRDKPQRIHPFFWFTNTFPQTFRRHIRAFWLSLAITLAGCAFGGLAIAFDPESKAVLMPFSHLMGNPSERVAREEKASHDRLADRKSTFSAFLMTHNTKVSVFTMALGATWGVGTILMLFYNGVILGAVIIDYVLAGQTPFLVGWLLPHGSFEIPAILIAGQAGLMLGGALIGWGKRITFRERLRSIAGDIVTLICGVAILLIWAGFVESFLSQYHEPVIPYAVKISFGVIELTLLCFFLARSGKSAASPTVQKSSIQRQ